MYEYYHGDLPAEGMLHHYRLASNPEFAFMEGWAEFFGFAVWVDKVGLQNLPLGMAVEEYYPPDWNPYWKDDYPYTNTDGTIVEGAVMQFLYDLYDKTTTNDASPDLDDESYSNPIHIFNALDYYDESGRRTFVNNIMEFYSAWLQDGNPDIIEIYIVDFFGTKPPAPNGLTATLGGENSIKLDWIDNPDWEGEFIVYRNANGGDFLL
jgi:hypothetical protein